MLNKGENNIESFPVYDKQNDLVKGIRYAFHKKDWQSALHDVGVLVSKGYDVYVQAMVTLSYSDIELIELINEVNKLDVFAAYIVDSFGAMLGDDFRRLHYLFEHNLRPGIRLGYHSHNNLQLAFSNAIDFVNIRNRNRSIILDSSIHGMGRGAGNLTTELVADYLNKNQAASYRIEPLLRSIDHHLEAIYHEYYWGYSIAHYLSAANNCHPNYASYLAETGTLTVVDMQAILNTLSNEDKCNYSKDIIEDLYFGYKTKSNGYPEIETDLFKGKEVVIIAPGMNSKSQKSVVDDYVAKKNPVVIAVNHIPDNYNPNWYFFSNGYRFESFYSDLDKSKLIITSNLYQKDYKDSNIKIVSYGSLLNMSRLNSDNVVVLLLNLLITQKSKLALLVGVDGYKETEPNYASDSLERVIDSSSASKLNEQLSNAISEAGESISIRFLTDSILKKT